jgi:hypothetical protein
MAGMVNAASNRANVTGRRRGRNDIDKKNPKADHPCDPKDQIATLSARKNGESIMRSGHLRTINEVAQVPKVPRRKNLWCGAQLTLDDTLEVDHISHVALQQATGNTGRALTHREDMT